MSIWQDFRVKLQAGLSRLLTGSRPVPQHFAGALGWTSPSTPGHVLAAPALCRPGPLPAELLQGLRQPGLRSLVPSSRRVRQHHPRLRPLRRPLPPRFPGRRQPLGTLGEGWRCNHRQQERGREEGRAKEANTGAAGKVAEGAGPGRSSAGRAADYFAWIVEEKRRL